LSRNLLRKVAVPVRDGGGKNPLNGLVIRAEMCYIAPPPRKRALTPEARLKDFDRSR
jgi:hypothetical protein